jgi:tyrosinase
LFGSWHRPYLAVFEQALYLAVQEVINEFPESQRQRLRDVARNLRIPYWDWAKYPGVGQPAVPASLRDQYVTVTKASGRVSIPNPLYGYNWGTSITTDMGGGPWDNFQQTLRRPVGNPTRSNNNEMNTRFASIRISLRDRIYGLFAARPVPSFGYVSTSQIGARPANGNNVDSFESIHDAIHVTAGGESGGHMYYLDYSAFDPIFWLHHTNVDRLLAMYQVTTPNSYIANGRIPHGMAQWNQGEEKNANSPLKPFTKNAKGDYFTSNDVKNTRTLGYFYRETANNNANDVYNAVASLYGPNAPRLKRSVEATSTPQFEGRPFKEGDENYVLSIVANKFALPGSYSIHCFLGSPSTNSTNATAPYPIANSTAPAPYPTGTGSPSHSGNSTDCADDFTLHPDYVGNYAVLGGTHTGDQLVTEGALPLTTALQGKEATGCLASLKREDVVPYLKAHLYYKVIGPGNVEIPANELPGLHVGVKACPVTPGENPYDMPSFGNYEKLPECTEGKPAGEPYTHELTPLEVVTPAEGEPYTPTEPETPSPIGSSYPTGTMAWPYPTAPENEDGYCVSHQTIKYVDMEGNFLYEETT